MTQATTATLPAIETLRPGKQWVCFDAGKLPHNPLTGKRVTGDLIAGNPSWATYEQAQNALTRNPQKYKGIGREFIKEQGITGVDLDHCIDEQGNLSEWARYTVELLDSYTEISPSGRGLHIWVYGSIPKKFKREGEQAIELDDCGKYFTITEKHLAGTPTTIEHRQEQLTALYEQVQEQREQAQRAKQQGKNRTQDKPIASARSLAGDTPYGLQALDNECHELAMMQEGGRNHQLNTSAYALGQLVAGHELTRSTVERELTDAARRSGLGEQEIANTLRSGIEAGMLSPRSAPVAPTTYAPAPTAHTQSNGHGADKNPPTDSTGGDASPEFVLDCLHSGEYGDGLLFAFLFRGKALYDHTEKEWYTWQGHYWKRDDTGRIKRYVSGRLASVYLRTCATLNEREAGIDETTDEGKERLAKLKRTIALLTKRAFELKHIARCKNVLNYAASEDDMAITAEQWDCNKWVLAVQNGVIDLRTGECREGKPHDYIRTVCPTEWRGINASARRWEQALQEIFEDRPDPGRQALISFLQRFFGYGITGETREHYFGVLYGDEGRNGKDTIAHALSYTLGPASGAISNDVLLDTGKNRAAGAATPHLSDLQGKRLAWASEPEKGSRFNVGQVKLLSGGGDISTRAPYEKRNHVFSPTHLLILLTNHKPHADANDSAFWDRLRLVTFNVRYVDNPSPDKPHEHKPDKALGNTLEQEASGILAWLVRGCLDWQKQGLNTPDEILAAGQSYRQEEDTIALFVEECCVENENARCYASEAYNRYKTWCDAGNMRAINSTNFGKLFSKRYQKERDNRGNYYQRVGLLSDYTQHTLEPVEPVQDTNQANGSVGCVGFSQEVSNSIVIPPIDTELYGKTIHTLHESNTSNAILEPVEPVQGIVHSSSNPTHTLHCMTIFERLQSESHGKPLAIVIAPGGDSWCAQCRPQYEVMCWGAAHKYPYIEGKDAKGIRIKIEAGYSDWLHWCKVMGYDSMRSALQVLNR